MISALISRLVILVFGTLYPAYSSYKAVKTKDLKLYVKWMMYWIVFALFTTAETFTDIFFSFWFPFYYELKVIIVIWLLSPVTKGSSIMYRRVIHPLFMRREKEIDELIAKAKDQGYNVILDIGCKGMSMATNAIMNTAVKNVPAVMLQSSQNVVAVEHRTVISGRVGRARTDEMDNIFPIAREFMQRNDTLMMDLSDLEADVTPTNDMPVPLSEESDEEYRAPRKKFPRKPTPCYRHTEDDKPTNDMPAPSNESDEEYRPPRKKTPRRSRKRESSTSRVTRSRKKVS